MRRQAEMVPAMAMTMAVARAMVIAIAMAVAMAGMAGRAGAAGVRGADPADLAVSVSGAPDPAGSGSTLTYRISIVNNGPGTAADTRLSVEIPTGTVFTSFTAPAGWTANAPAPGGTGTVTAIQSSLAPGGTATFTLVLTTATHVADGAAITLSAAAASATTDPGPQNNTAAATTHIRNAADLAVSATADRDPAAAADLRYTITLTNAGPAAASPVTLTATTPSGTSFTSFTAPVPWASTTPPVGGAGAVTSTADRLPSGGQVRFELVVTVLADIGDGALVDLTAAVDSTTPDPVDRNDTATVRARVANTADLAVAVSDQMDPVAPTDSVSYAITLTNNGPATAAGPTLSIGIPAGAAFSALTAPTGWTVSAPPEGAGGTVTASATELAPASPAAFTLTLIPQAPGEIRLTATAATHTTDPVADNDTAAETTTVTATARTTQSTAATQWGALPLNDTSLVRLGGATAVLVGLGLLSFARGRARRARHARRGYH